MTVLIANINQEYIKGLHPKVKFNFSTQNTCTFNISEKKFVELRDKIREGGNNPYSIMSW